MDPFLVLDAYLRFCVAYGKYKLTKMIRQLLIKVVLDVYIYNLYVHTTLKNIAVIFKEDFERRTKHLGCLE